MRTRPIGEIFAIVCVGFAFSAFKIILGQFLLTQKYNVLGVISIGWGIIDVVINLINLITLSVLKKRVIRVCLLNYIVGCTLSLLPFVKHQGPKDLGVALDVFVAFAIVAFMVGGGFLVQLTPTQGTVWDWSVVLNVLYAGVNRLIDSTSRLTVRRS